MDNWTALFTPGERVRLRVINASAMTTFNVRVPGLPLSIVQADGQNVVPVTVDEFQIGVAETYDVVVSQARTRPILLSARPSTARVWRAPRSRRAPAWWRGASLAQAAARRHEGHGHGHVLDAGHGRHGHVGRRYAGVDPTAEQNASARLATGAAAALMATMDNSAMAGMDHSGMDHSAMSGWIMDRWPAWTTARWAPMADGGHGSRRARDGFDEVRGLLERAAGKRVRASDHLADARRPHRQSGQGLTDVGHKVLVYAT
jgi:FtsP/CotA-like multicopper oxidase with cupredoxin domain